jgi:hypothetical protein
MRFEPLGELTPDEHVCDWLVSAPFPIPLLDGVALPFTLENLPEDPAPDDFVAAVRSFLSLDARDRERAAPHVFDNYRQVALDWGLSSHVPRIRRSQDIWSAVHPAEIRVSRRHRRDRKVYVQVHAECDWEPEHGLQLVYRDGGALSRVSEQDGHLTYTDAFDLPEEEDRIR